MLLKSANNLLVQDLVLVVVTQEAAEALEVVLEVTQAVIEAGVQEVVVDLIAAAVSIVWAMVAAAQAAI